MRADATRSLRGVAAALGSALGCPVHAVSLLHSTGIDPTELDGQAAELLEPALEGYLAAGGRSAVALPLFFGPSAALTDYVPARLTALRTRHPAADLRQAACLVDIERPEDGRIAAALADAVRTTVRQHSLRTPPVLLVDHGTPQPAVTAVREHLGVQLQRELAGEIGRFGTAAMERRDGLAFAFNDPLLENALDRAPFDHGEVVVALQFLAPGRHAGPGGDIAQICTAAEARHPGLRTRMTEPLGVHPRLLDVLTERYREAVRPDFSAR